MAAIVTWLPSGPITRMNEDTAPPDKCSTCAGYVPDWKNVSSRYNQVSVMSNGPHVAIACDRYLAQYRRGLLRLVWVSIIIILIFVATWWDVTKIGETMSSKKKFLKVASEAERDIVDAEIDRQEAEARTKHPLYHYPRNAQEWWDVLKEYWQEITNIWFMFGVASVGDNPITRENLLEMRRKRKSELEAFCHRAWAAAPDNGSIHALPAWNVLCDLCSEAGVLYDDTPEANRMPVPEESEVIQ